MSMNKNINMYLQKKRKKKQVTAAETLAVHIRVWHKTDQLQFNKKLNLI